MVTIICTSEDIVELLITLFLLTRLRNLIKNYQRFPGVSDDHMYRWSKSQCLPKGIIQHTHALQLIIINRFKCSTSHLRHTKYWAQRCDNFKWRVE